MKTSAGQIVGIVIGLIVLVCFLFCTVVAVLDVFSLEDLTKKAREYKKVNYENQLVPEWVDGMATFTTDKNFKILQLTDIHICGGILSTVKDGKAVKAVADVVTYAKPDLVIVTGDLSFAVPSSLNLSNKKVYEAFCELMDTLGVYWTVCYGNHDSEYYNFTSRAKLSKWLENSSYKYCLFKDDNDGVYGHGNQFINVRNSLGIVTQTLVLIDSNDYKPFPSRDYDRIHDDQVDWYVSGINYITEKNKARLDALGDGEEPYPDENFLPVKSLAFFHIPTEEFKTAIKEYELNNSDTENTKYIYGKSEESVCSPKDDSKFFEAALELKSTQAIFVGHDHVNNTALCYKGIDLCYSYSIDYFAYKDIDKKDDYRGGTLITVRPDGTASHRLLSITEAR